jgi:hypothetical protein
MEIRICAEPGGAPNHRGPVSADGDACLDDLPFSGAQQQRELASRLDRLDQSAYAVRGVRRDEPLAHKYVFS